MFLSFNIIAAIFFSSLYAGMPIIISNFSALTLLYVNIKVEGKILDHECNFFCIDIELFLIKYRFVYS